MKINIKDIFEGYTNLVKSWIGIIPTEVKQIADKRKQICNSCSTQSWLFGIDFCDTDKGGCGCVGSAKRLCMGEGCDCPLNK